jgi:hypothetical protein
MTVSGGWGERHDGGTGSTQMIEDANKALDAIGIPRGSLALRAIAAVGMVDRLRGEDAETSARRSRRAPKLYNVTCSFKDGSKSHYEGLSFTDLLEVVGTFDGLAIGVSVSIEIVKAS